MFTALIEKVIRHCDLSEAEASAAMTEVMEGRATAAELAGLLAVLAMKGERPSEIVGFARTMRAHAIHLAAPPKEMFDTCGTGGDHSGTFNISSATALVVAACGVVVAKHGNRSVSSRCGSADVFESLGVNVGAEPVIVERSLNEAGIAFLFAPIFHPSMRHAGPIRRSLGIRTVFNLLGPLTNPAGVSRQIIGVPAPELTQLMAQALVQLETDRAWIVHGADGLDELSTTGFNKISECRDGNVHTFYVHPSDFGIPTSRLTELTGGDSKANATIIRKMFTGTRGPQRDVVVLNAGASLFVSGSVNSVREGIDRAEAAIDRGDAQATLDRMVACSLRSSE
jgi:anthranilate phosphoribosyltransferase